MKKIDLMSYYLCVAPISKLLGGGGGYCRKQSSLFFVFHLLSELLNTRNQLPVLLRVHVGLATY